MTARGLETGPRVARARISRHGPLVTSGSQRRAGWRTRAWRWVASGWTLDNRTAEAWSPVPSRLAARGRDWRRLPVLLGGRMRSRRRLIQDLRLISPRSPSLTSGSMASSKMMRNIVILRRKIWQDKVSRLAGLFLLCLRCRQIIFSLIGSFYTVVGDITPLLIALLITLPRLGPVDSPQATR